MKTFCVVFAVCVAVTSLLTAMPQKKDFQDRVFGSRENLDFILHAEQVTACRLKVPRGDDGKVEHHKLRSDDTLKHYKVEAAIDVPAKIREELYAILKDPATYESAGSKSCIPIYGVRFSFTKGAKTLTVNLCLLCDILATADADMIIGMGSFDTVDDRLLAIAQMLFPHDEDFSGMR